MIPPEKFLAPHPILSPYYHEADQRSAFVRQLFDRTAHHYDYLNRLLSLGSGNWYRRRCLQRAGLVPGMHVLDVATGTGLLARQAVQITGNTQTVVGLDVSTGMLAEAHRTLKIPLIQGTVECLPVADASVDFLTMGYALRHATDLLATFREFYRVLRTSGTLLILEISPPPSALGQLLLRLYMRHCLPLLARWTTGQQETHTLLRYYWETMAHCVPPATIVYAMGQAGFPETRCEVECGLFRAYLGRKL